MALPLAMAYHVGLLLLVTAMDRVYPYALRRQRRNRLRQRVAAVIAASLAVTALAFAFKPDSAPYAPVAPAAPLAAAPVSAPSPAPGRQHAARRIYPYSIVPGGVASQAELAQVVRTDKVVAAHYADFDVSKARAVTVTAPRAVYVSYRKGDKVYWTAKKLMLKVGETLFTDGRNEMRARCANRISDVPRFPVEANGPGPEELDTPAEETEGGLALVSIEEPEAPGGIPRPTGLWFRPTTLAGGKDPARRGPLDANTPPLGWDGIPYSPLRGLRTAGVSGSAPPTLVGIDVQPPVDASAPPQAGNTDVADSAPPLADNTPAQPGNPDPRPFVPEPDLTRPPPPLIVLDQPKPADVPEPAAAWLMGVALMAMFAVRRKGRK